MARGGAALMLVVDASIALATTLPDESTGGPPVFDDDVVAPWLLWVETRNALLGAERRGRMGSTDCDRALDALDALGITLDTTPSSTHVMALARRHGLTAYDALYLELALRRGADLATADRVLAAAARAEGVRVR